VPEVEVPSRYRVPTQGEALIEVDASTVRACIEAVESRYPGFGELIIDRKGELNRFVKLFLNGDQLDRDALDTPVNGNDRVSVVASAAGG
jgi:molybdopterin converting factor small subunit